MRPRETIAPPSATYCMLAKFRHCKSLPCLRVMESPHSYSRYVWKDGQWYDERGWVWTAQVSPNELKLYGRGILIGAQAGAVLPMIISPLLLYARNRRISWKEMLLRTSDYSLSGSVRVIFICFYLFLVFFRL